MRTNAAVQQAKVFTHEGGRAANISVEQQLLRSVMATMLFENQAYEDGQEIGERIKALASQVSPAFLANVAIEARENMKLRHVPLLLARELARHPRFADVSRIVQDTIARVIQRADELAEFVALYLKEKKQPLSAQVKKGLARAFQKFDRYQLGKYNRDYAVKLRDVLFLCHAKPADVCAEAYKWNKAARANYDPNNGFVRPFTDGEIMFGELVNDKLATPDTWEVALSAGADKAATFRRLMAEGQLGALAFLRNLRNMVESGIAKAEVAEYAKTARVDRVLPFRFLAAARHVPAWEDIIEQMMMRCLDGKEKMPGKTVLFVDVSGSMDRVAEEEDARFAGERGMRGNHFLTPKAERELEERFGLEKEAIELLGLVVAEWESDPMSVQCFDLRVVERAKAVIKRLRQLPRSIFG